MRHIRKSTSKNITQQGFSLVELLVSLALFSVVITMSVGTMIVLLDANAKTQNMNVLMTNLSFSLSSLSREVRTGFSYYCDRSSVSAPVPSALQVRDCSDGTRLSIVEADNSLTNVTRGNYTEDSRITYYFDPNYYGTDKGAILRRLGEGAVLPLTSAEIDIDMLSFRVAGSAVAGDSQTPRARIIISGTAGNIEGLDTAFHIQTMVTQRLLDI